ncbi:MarR family protein, partial [Halolamina pelagica]
MLRRIELEVLATVDRGDTISELATKLDHSESYLSRAVADLVEKGLVYTERDGRRKRVVPSDARAVELYRDLVRQHSHIEFPELLTGKALEVLYYLDQPRTVSEIADRSDNYRNTVNRVLKRFRDRGLVGTADGHYEFNADFDRLHEFARELAHHLHRQRLEAVAPKGTILWEDYDEFLAQAETEIDAAAFHETGLARFAAFDLQFLLTGHRYYVYSEDLDAVSPAELCCHTLLIDDGSRHRSSVSSCSATSTSTRRTSESRRRSMASKTKSTPCCATSRRTARLMTSGSRSGTSSSSWRLITKSER